MRHPTGTGDRVWVTIRAVSALAYPDIGVVETTGAHFDQNLAVARHRYIDLAVFELVQSPVPAGDHRVHYSWNHCQPPFCLTGCYSPLGRRYPPHSCSIKRASVMTVSPLRIRAYRSPYSAMAGGTASFTSTPRDAKASAVSPPFGARGGADPFGVERIFEGYSERRHRRRPDLERDETLVDKSAHRVAELVQGLRIQCQRPALG